MKTEKLFYICLYTPFPMIMKYFSLIVTAVVMHFASDPILFAQSNLKSASHNLSTQEIDRLVLQAMDEFQVAGAAVAVIKDGQVLHQKGYGVRSVETGLPVDKFTNFQIASNSKAFTTAALAILVDRGQISWKDRVKKHIPEFTMYDQYVEEQFTIEDLLCHRSGMGLGVGDLMAFPDGADFTLTDVLTSFQHFKAVSDFRTEYAYDNLLYWVAGEVIARVSGMTWEEFVQQNIFNPLEMNASYPSASVISGLDHILAENAVEMNLALPHSTENEEGKYRPIRLYQAAISGSKGGILSNVHDLSKWVLTQLNQGKHGKNSDQQLFSPARQQEMWRIHTVTDRIADSRYRQHFSGYGLGWNLSDILGNLRVSHTGALPGMLSQVFMIPDMGLGIVILTNTEGGGSFLFQAVNNTILDHYLGLNDQSDKVDWIARLRSASERRQASGDLVTEQVWQQVEDSKNIQIQSQDYVGVYEDKWFGKIEVFESGDQLWFRSYRSPRLNGPMQYYEDDTFAIRWDYQDMNADAFAIFGMDENGRAQSIKMKGISPNIDFSFDFHDLDLLRVEDPQWIQLFNGVDLNDWTVKIAKHELGENYAETFRVEDGLLKVRYDGYQADFDQQYGHLHYNTPFSAYILRVTYRFVGEQAPGGEGWAWRNSGVMLHGQDPATMLRDQDFPISIEAQLLGGDGTNLRTTGNLCTPGTQVVMNGVLFTPHCINSNSETYHGDQWVTAEFLVLGDSLIQHIVEGKTVLSYSKPQIGGGNVFHYDPEMKVDGTPLSGGYISLQSESHPVDFRRVELLDLSPYMGDPEKLQQVLREANISMTK